MPFENIVGQGEDAGNQYFLLFSVFSILSKRNSINYAIFHLGKSKILLSAKRSGKISYKYMKNSGCSVGNKTVFSVTKHGNFG